MSPEVFTAEQAKKVGEKLGVDWSRFDVELEHEAEAWRTRNNILLFMERGPLKAPPVGYGNPGR